MSKLAIRPRGVSAGAQFSDDRAYRYSLWRVWDEDKGKVMFIGLNPSTADETHDDPTIRRCVRFAKDWGFGGVYMLNLFAIRATDPAVMKLVPEPIGPSNDYALEIYAGAADLVVAAWGRDGAHRDRGAFVRRLIDRVLTGRRWLCLRHLGLTQGGHPKHPLYLSKETRPQQWL